MIQPQTDSFRAIADPGRRAILNLLTKEALTINTLAVNFNISRPAVSKHIKILFDAGLIYIEDIGRERHCSLRKEGFAELRQWLTYFDRLWNKKLDALGDFLNESEPATKKAALKNK